jgi:hypothetical protein
MSADPSTGEEADLRGPASRIPESVSDMWTGRGYARHVQRNWTYFFGFLPGATEQAVR